jgi:hypothetical protein
MACNCLKRWWPGTESNRRRQPFQGSQHTDSKRLRSHGWHRKSLKNTRGHNYCVPRCVPWTWTNKKRSTTMAASCLIRQTEPRVGNAALIARSSARYAAGFRQTRRHTRLRTAQMLRLLPAWKYLTTKPHAGPQNINTESLSFVQRARSSMRPTSAPSSRSCWPSPLAVQQVPQVLTLTPLAISWLSMSATL